MNISLRGAIFCVVSVTAAWGASATYTRTAHQALPDVHIESVPMTLGEWTGKDGAPLDERSLGILNLDRSIKREYHHSSGAVISLYIGYWRSQSGDSQAAKHSPALCLPANGWKISLPEQFLLSKRGTELGQEATNRFSASRLIGSLHGTTSLFTYWFFRGAETYPSETEALLETSVGMLFNKRSDGGIVELSLGLPSGVSREDAVRKAQELTDDFMHSLVPALDALIRS